MGPTLADVMYERHRDALFGVILTRHFFQRFFQRFNSWDQLEIILRDINRHVPEYIFQIEVYGPYQRIKLPGCLVGIILDKKLSYPRLVVTTVF